MIKKYDIIVIGGGPAGMMAAGTAASVGASVLLLEKNDRLGTKLLITGKQRCNITNTGLNKNNLADIYGPNGRFLHSAWHSFSNNDVISFFEDLGVKTKVERGDRVFPESDRAIDILNALKNYLNNNNVTVNFNANVAKFKKHHQLITNIVLSNGDEYEADKFIITTGGKSYPETGSTGDAYTWLIDLGHKVVKPRPALAPILMSDDFIAKLEGLSLRNVKITLFDKNNKIDTRFGEALFTSRGMSGPTILDISRLIHGFKQPSLSIDFKPALDNDQIDKRIQRDFDELKNKMFRNSLTKLLPQKLIPVFIKLSNINPDKKVNEITKEERRNLVGLLKDFRLHISGLDGYRKAIITAGGVDLKEVDPKTMHSKLIGNLYFAGEVLDLDGPTGGYNLQVCWSTGYTAGSSAAT